MNDQADLFDHLRAAKPYPDMIKLATQLIDRQAAQYDPGDGEDRYEARIRAVIEAKLNSEGMEAEDAEEPDRSNVVDLMAALRTSFGQPTKVASTPKKVTKALAKAKAVEKVEASRKAASKPKVAEQPASAPVRTSPRKRA